MKICKTKEMLDMCFLGVFLGAPGGPPAASLGGPRGHGREEGGETVEVVGSTS